MDSLLYLRIDSLMSRVGPAEVLSLTTNLILFAGLFVAVWQVALLRRQMRSQLNWSRLQATFDYSVRYRSELHDINLELQKQLNLLRQDGKPIDESELSLSLLSDETRLHIFELVTYFEQLAIGIERKFLDDAVAYDHLANPAISVYQSLKQYLEARRGETGMNVGQHFETLAKRWELVVPRAS